MSYFTGWYFTSGVVTGKVIHYRAVPPSEIWCDWEWVEPLQAVK
jgi:hypothetical protein